MKQGIQKLKMVMRMPVLRVMGVKNALMRRMLKNVNQTKTLK